MLDGSGELAGDLLFRRIHQIGEHRQLRRRRILRIEIRHDMRIANRDRPAGAKLHILQTPMFKSGGAGAQSTKVMARSVLGSGGKISMAMALAPAVTASVMFSSKSRYVPMIFLESAICFPFNQMFAR